MNYTKAEQETTIVWDEEQKTAHIYTSSPIGIRKLDRLAASYPEDYADGMFYAHMISSGLSILAADNSSADAINNHLTMAILSARQKKCYTPEKLYRIASK